MVSITIWYLSLCPVFIFTLVFRQPYVVEYSAIFSDNLTLYDDKFAEDRDDAKYWRVK